jgi:hypothetical protein
MTDTFTRHTRNGTQTYTFVGVEPHINRKGYEISLNVWQSQCRTCGATFKCRAGSKRGPENVHCPDHRRQNNAAGMARNHSGTIPAKGACRNDDLRPIE